VVTEEGGGRVFRLPRDADGAEIIARLTSLLVGVHNKESAWSCSDASPHDPQDHIVRPTTGEGLEYHEQVLAGDLVSDLTFSERRVLEQVLGMASGYVLDFTDRTFEEFIREHTGREIWNARYEYKSGSKANRLRAFWTKEENALVGKLLIALLDYNEETSTRALACRQIAQRLLGTATTRPSDNSHQTFEQIAQQAGRSRTLCQLKERFTLLNAEKDRNKAGLALEQLLNELFEVFDLRPRQPYRVVGEQIDGSFELDGHVYLVESKWEKHALPEADLLIFKGKIESKSPFTRGVFIALNGITEPAKYAITRGQAPPFFVMDGYDLLMILSEAIDLREFLKRRVRLLAEEGCVSVPFTAL